MYPSKIMGQNITLAHLKPTLKNATILSHLVCDNALYLSSVFDYMVQAYETPKDTLNCLKYDEECQLQQEMLPYHIFQNGTLVGEITAEWKDKETMTEVIYWLGKKYVGNGYISDALKLMERALFRAGHQEIRLYIDAANRRSADVAGRCGYQLSENTNYYFKTRQMYCENTIPICRHDTYPKWAEIGRCLFR